MKQNLEGVLDGASKESLEEKERERAIGRASSKPTHRKRNGKFSIIIKLP